MAWQQVINKSKSTLLNMSNKNVYNNKSNPIILHPNIYSILEIVELNNTYPNQIITVSDDYAGNNYSDNFDEAYEDSDNYFDEAYEDSDDEISLMLYDPRGCTKPRTPGAKNYCNCNCCCED